MDWSYYFEYDETSPSGLRNKVKRGVKAPKDAVTGTKHPRDYWYVTVNGKTYPVHRIVYEMVNRVKIADGNVIDHIDGDSYNNKASNLREVPWIINLRNSKRNCTNRSGVPGVSLDEKNRGEFYWLAYWTEADGTRSVESFAVSKYGDTVAFLLACGTRYSAICRLNSEGAGYSEEHGLKPNRKQEQ
jgi:hypothetical protein